MGVTREEINALLDVAYASEDELKAALELLSHEEPTPLVVSTAEVLRRMLDAMQQQGKPRKVLTYQRPLYKGVERTRRITALGRMHSGMEAMVERAWKRSMQELQNRVLRRLREAGR